MFRSYVDLGFDLDIGLDVLQEASFSENAMDVGIELRTVAYGAGETSDKYHVNGVGLVGPVKIYIVNLKEDIGGNIVGLDGGDVSANSLSGGVLVGKVSGCN